MKSLYVELGSNVLDAEYVFDGETVEIQRLLYKGIDVFDLLLDADTILKQKASPLNKWDSLFNEIEESIKNYELKK